jgi:hypothetical protein
MADQRFAYHRAVAPMLWVLVGIGTLELAVVHLLVSLLWSRTGALVLSLVSLALLLWLVAAIVSMKRRPVLLDGETLLMRVGMLKTIAVPVSSIRGLRTQWNAAELKRRSVINLALVAYPNVIVDLAEPRPGRRGITAVAHRFDDPAAFVAAIERLGACDD